MSDEEIIAQNPEEYARLLEKNGGPSSHKFVLILMSKQTPSAKVSKMGKRDMGMLDPAMNCWVTSRADQERKAKELREQGYEVRPIKEAIADARREIDKAPAKPKVNKKLLRAAIEGAIE